MGTIRKRYKSSHEISWYDAGKKRFETVKGDKESAKKALRAREVAVDEGRSTEWIIRRLVKVAARVSHHARRWYVHLASSLPLAHHYRAVFETLK